MARGGATSPAPRDRTTIAGAVPPLLRDVLRGLAAPRPALPPRYFYDDVGAALFDRICTLPEYYLTRTEVAILEERAPALAAEAGPAARVVEFGSGSGLKTRILLRALRDPAEYLPVDVASAQLHQLAAELRREFPHLHVSPVTADYTDDPLPTLDPAAPGRTLAFFPGSSIGNLEHEDAVHFLTRVRTSCGRGGALVVGTDLHKDTATLERAYNDSQGVTAAFNLNLLARINRECGADFPLAAFQHRAHYDTRLMRIEMHLECRGACEVHVPVPGADAACFAFRPGDTILTEYSHKYTVESFTALARRAAWSVQHCWTDPDRWFGVWLLT